MHLFASRTDETLQSEFWTFVRILTGHSPIGEARISYCSTVEVRVDMRATVTCALRICHLGPVKSWVNWKISF